MQGYGLGRVPKWPKGTDCKSVIRGFKSHLGLSLRALNLLHHLRRIPLYACKRCPTFWTALAPSPCMKDQEDPKLNPPY